MLNTNKNYIKKELIELLKKIAPLPFKLFILLTERKLTHTRYFATVVNSPLHFLDRFNHFLS